MVASKANTYQALGNLQEAAKLLSGTNEQTPSNGMYSAKLIQLRLERNYGDAIRLMKARRFPSDFERASNYVYLAFIQRFAGDVAAAKVTAEQARTTLEQYYRDQPDKLGLAEQLSKVYAVIGEKDLTLKTAERAIMFTPRAKDAVAGPALEENLALIQTIFGEKSRAISTLTQLLQTPYPGPLTPALLRLDPTWDPLRSDPAFQKLCEEKKM
jgi:tetratricopeptide (TPR) repeat protein